MSKHIHVYLPAFGRAMLSRLRVSDVQVIKGEEYEDLVRRLKQAIAELQGQTQDEDFGHEFHGNQWTGGLGSKPTQATVKGVKAGTHELLSSGHPFTMEELQKATGATTLKQVSDALAMLKNPKYAGSKGTLEIVKEGANYVVKKKAAEALAQEAVQAAKAPAAANPLPGPAEAPQAPEKPLDAPAEAKPGAPMPKEEADKLYAQQMQMHMFDIQTLAKNSPAGDAEKIAQQFKDKKAAAMSQWKAHVTGVDQLPKKQQVFKADLELVHDLASGASVKDALAKWKENTKNEKAGTWPAKVMAEPTAAQKSDAEKMAAFTENQAKLDALKLNAEKAHAPAFAMPAEYVPSTHEHVSDADFQDGTFDKQMSDLRTKLMQGHPDAVQNKIGVQASLENRLKDSPAFQTLQAEYTKKMGGGSIAAKLISAWASSSGDHQPISVAAQLSIRDAFGMKDNEVAKDAFHLITKSGAGEDEVYKQAGDALGFSAHTPERMQTLRSALHDFALAQYANTQDHLKQKGITHLYVARGMKIGSGTSDAERVKLRLQPASSFSANHSTAHGFGGGGTIYYAKVPASQVLSSYVTGYGCTSEHEVVVLAHPDMQAVRLGNKHADYQSAALAKVGKDLAAKSGTPIKTAGGNKTLGGAGAPAKPVTSGGTSAAALKAHLASKGIVEPKFVTYKAKNSHAAAAKAAGKKGDIEGMYAAAKTASEMGYPNTAKNITNNMIPTAEKYAEKLKAYKQAMAEAKAEALASKVTSPKVKVSSKMPEGKVVFNPPSVDPSKVPLPPHNGEYVTEAYEAAKKGNLKGVENVQKMVKGMASEAVTEYLNKLHAHVSGAPAPAPAPAMAEVNQPGSMSVPKHHAEHPFYKPDQYKQWQQAGYSEKQIGKKLAMIKFLNKPKGVQ